MEFIFAALGGARLSFTVFYSAEQIRRNFLCRTHLALDSILVLILN